MVAPMHATPSSGCVAATTVTETHPLWHQIQPNSQPMPMSAIQMVIVSSSFSQNCLMSQPSKRLPT
jgi:hypothetical protein